MSFVHNKNKIEGLKDLIRTSLNKHINGDYVLLDIPNYNNIGDSLIWQGELEYLKELEYKCLYTANPYTCDLDKIPKNAIILFQGGGNFGDTWDLNQDFRNRIITKFKDNKIIIFPQTIFYNDTVNLVRDIEIYKNHSNLIICARDQVSYKIACDNFTNNTIYLLPDMAFFLNLDEFHRNGESQKYLVMKRVDKELGDIKLLESVVNGLKKNSIAIDVSDWPGFYERNSVRRKFQVLYNIFEMRFSKMLIKSRVFSFLVDDKHGLRGKDYKDKLILKGIGFINRYDIVYSTRLHGFILAVLLNKEVYIFDNSYGKNKQFFDTWLHDFQNVKLIEK